jgi:hypothetical protein
VHVPLVQRKGVGRETPAVRPRGARVAPPRAPDRIRERGPQQVTAGMGVRETRREAPRKSGTRARGRCIAYGNVSSSARAESVKAQWIDDDPPDLIVEKVNRTVEDLISAAPERAGFSVGAHSGRSPGVPPNG